MKGGMIFDDRERKIVQGVIIFLSVVVGGILLNTMYHVGRDEAELENVEKIKTAFKKGYDSCLALSPHIVYFISVDKNKRVDTILKTTDSELKKINKTNLH